MCHIIKQRVINVKRDYFGLIMYVGYGKLFKNLVTFNDSIFY